MIQLLLADDHAIVRKGLKALFSLSPDIVVSAEAFNAAQVLDTLRNEVIDLIVLDMNMPGTSGTDLISRIRGRKEAPPILVLSMHTEPQLVRRTLAAGAAGYLTKDNEPEVLIEAIRKIAAGGRFLDPAIAQVIAFESTSATSQSLPHETLSERELQIFLMLAKGESVSEIALQLAISNKTVSTYKARMMDKMAVSNNAGLVKYAMAYGLIN